MNRFIDIYLYTTYYMTYKSIREESVVGRGYQYNFSEKGGGMFQKKERQRKALTMVNVLTDASSKKLNSLSLLNVGGSAGIIDEYLSNHFKNVTGMDIDEKAILYAKSNFEKNNLSFELGDAMKMNYASSSFDVIVCSQVYEHVPDAKILVKEIYRVLVPGGLVYFAAGNRLMFNEPHHNLPLLSVIPRPLAHLYMRLFRKGKFYYEKHLTYWGLKNLVHKFEINDYTKEMILFPRKYNTEYMIEPGSWKHKLSSILVKYIYWIIPGYIWVLRKPNIKD